MKRTTIAAIIAVAAFSAWAMSPTCPLDGSGAYLLRYDTDPVAGVVKVWKCLLAEHVFVTK